MGLTGLMLVFAGCRAEIGQVCTQVGCSGQVELTVLDAEGAEVSDLAGTIAIGDRTFAVDCAGTSDEGVSCSGGTISISLGDDIGDEDVVFDLHRAAISVTSTLALDWSSAQPNGASCPPTCWTANGTVAIDDPGT